MRNKRPRKNKSCKPLKKGLVYLVGAGPGDPGLLTLRGAEVLEQADVVIYDGLVHEDVLRLAPHAEKIYVGRHEKKMGASRELSGEEKQKRIHEMMQRFSHAGKTIVRLKGGDPFVFGRGGEEADFLDHAGIPCEIISGVSSGIAVPAAAGIPVTDRRSASSVLFVTAHEKPGGGKVDWCHVAANGGTTVCFMGVKMLPQVVQKLIRLGKEKNTPACMIEWGTLPKQRSVEGTLATIAGLTKKSNIHSPALLIFGDVVKLRKKRNSFERKPLFGKKVLVTRTSGQAGKFSKLLREHGAEAIEVPLIEIKPPANPKPLYKAIEKIDEFEWMVLTSTNGVEAFFRALDENGWDARRLARLKIAVVGENTARAMRERGIRPDLAPAATTEDLFRLLKEEMWLKGRQFLLPRTDIAPDTLRNKLEEEGAYVTDVVSYRTVTSEEGRKKLARILRAEKPDYITFTSASTVEAFAKALTPAQRKDIRSKIVSIGPMTSAAVRLYGLRLWREARAHTLEGVIETLQSP